MTVKIDDFFASIDSNLQRAHDRVSENQAKQLNSSPGTQARMQEIANRNDIAKHERAKLTKLENQAHSLKASFGKLEQRAEVAKNANRSPDEWLQMRLGGRFGGSTAVQELGHLEAKLSRVLGEVRKVMMNRIR